MAKKSTKKYVLICNTVRYLYAKPDYTSDRIGKPGKGDKIEYVTKKTINDRIWYQVKYGDKKLWIKAVGTKLIEE